MSSKETRNNMYFLTKWEGRMGKYFPSGPPIDQQVHIPYDQFGDKFS